MKVKFRLDIRMRPSHTCKFHSRDLQTNFSVIWYRNLLHHTCKTKVYNPMLTVLIVVIQCHLLILNPLKGVLGLAILITRGSVWACCAICSPEGSFFDLNIPDRALNPNSIKCNQLITSWYQTFHIYYHSRKSATSTIQNLKQSLIIECCLFRLWRGQIWLWSRGMAEVASCGSDDISCTTIPIPLAGADAFTHLEAVVKLFH